MTSFEEYQIEKFKEIVKSINLVSNSLNLINNLNQESKLNIADKFYLLNKDINTINIQLENIFLDIKEKSCILDTDTLMKK